MKTSAAPQNCEIEARRDRIAGVILGSALGDAVGLPAEGSDSYTLSERYPSGVHYPHKGCFRGYPSNDWTDATDTTVVAMRSLASCQARSNGGWMPATLQSAFAARVLEWHKKGFPELGDTGGLHPEAVLSSVLSNPGYAETPVAVAMGARTPVPGNGALIRTSPCAFVNKPAVAASVLCMATHADERCVAASVTLVGLLDGMCSHPIDSTAPNVMAVVAAVSAGREHMADPANRAEFMKCVTDTRVLSGLKLDDRYNQSHVFKTLAVAVWTWRQIVKTCPSKRDGNFFKAVIMTIASEGGDASANCAVAGAILGAALGGNRLPTDWTATPPNKDWLEKEIGDFAYAMSAEPGGHTQS
jgi:ADP-ribosylglycohydrolase